MIFHDCSFMNVLTAYDKPFHNDQKSSTIVNFICIMNSSLSWTSANDSTSQNCSECRVARLQGENEYSGHDL